MEQYLDAKVKRYVQKRLFSQVRSARMILGLAGPYPYEYMRSIFRNIHFGDSTNIRLVDLNPAADVVRKNTIVAEFDILQYNHPDRCPVTFVDCDFCKSIINCGDDLLYIYNKMKKNNVRNKYITFTFSLRKVGLEATLNWLLHNFPELYIQSPKSLDLNILQHRQYVKEYSPVLFGYRDSGENMISGIIKINN